MYNRTERTNPQEERGKKMEEKREEREIKTTRAIIDKTCSVLKRREEFSILLLSDKRDFTIGRECS